MKLRSMLCALLLLATTVSAQHKRTHAGPSIGVALEGGGALGYAHIAVLQWLEDNQIPVDYVAGTSMGALVGGMYALGTKPSDIKKLVQELDPATILSSDGEYGDLSFRYREERRAYLNSLQLNLREGFHLPAGLTSAQNVNFILEKAALPYSRATNFDQLPIPFACVATNLITGKEKVFRVGSLSTAMRASMSIPGVFTAVRKDDDVFVDGGLVENLPVQALKDMGAEVIIAVHLKKKSLQPDDIQSVLDVLEKSLDVMIQANAEASLALLNKKNEPLDIEIDVDVSGFQPIDFGKLDEIMARGTAAAKAASSALLRRKASDEDWEAYRADRKSRMKDTNPTPRDIRVGDEVPKEKKPPQLAAEIKDGLVPFIGAAVDTAKLQETLTSLNREGRFTRIEYRMAAPDAPDDLLVATQEKGYRVNRIRIGFEMNGFEPGEVQYSAGAGATLLDLGGLNSDLRLDFAVGSLYRASGEYFHPFTPQSRWFIAPRGAISSAPLNLISRGTFLSAYRFYRAGGAVDLGYRIGNWAELRAGYELGRLRDALRIGQLSLPQLAGRTGATSLRFRVDRVDDPVVPREGVVLNSSFRWFDAAPGAAGGFPLGETHFGAFKRLKKSDPAGKEHSTLENGSVFFYFSGGTTFGYQSTGLPQFFLGSARQFAAYGSNELRTNDYFLFRLGYEHQIYQLPSLLGKGVFATGAYEIGKVYSAPGASRLPNDFAAGLVMETILGPAFVGYSFGDAGHRKWFFQLGHVF